MVVDPFLSIQAGINLASDGDRINVEAGTYVENITFLGKNIEVVGQDSSSTIIDGGQNGPVVRFQNGENETALLKNFTLTNGSGYFDINVTKGGGVYCYGNMASPTLENLCITGNQADQGGGVHALNSSIIIKTSRIIQNTAEGGGGMWLEGQDGGATIMDSHINHNQAGNGGGVYFYAFNKSTFNNVHISHNTATGRGGGCYLTWNSEPIFRNFSISSNTATNNGGGVYSQEESTPL